MAAAALLALLTLSQDSVAASRPNLIVILADDLGYGDLGCYGNQVNRTPHLDRLAREGLRLTDFHSNGANCSPTRAALLTGRYQQRMRIEGALGENAPGLVHEEVTIAERLREAGYATALFGKWHLGYFPHRGPTRQGFEDFIGHLHGATDYISHVDKYGRLDWWHGEQQGNEAGHNTELITEHSIDYIERHRDEPFFLLVSHSAIHFPWMTPKDEAYREQGKRYEGSADKIGPHAGTSLQPVVQRMIEQLDDSVGRILATLEQLEIDQRTFVFFTSDNGGIVRMAGVPIRPENTISSNAPLRGQKHGLYEGGHRVPAIAWWPGTISAGRMSKATAMTMDLHPTLLQLAGIPFRESNVDDDQERPPLDGVNLRDLLLGRKTGLPKRTLFWRQGDSRAVRRGNWKLVSIHDGPVQLFDLGADLEERRDLSARRPQIVRDLEDAFRRWEHSVSR